MEIETGLLLKNIRKERGLTQEQFAGVLGISRSNLAQMESNKLKLSYDVMHVLVNTYGVNPQLFFTKEPEKENRLHALEAIERFWEKIYGLDYDVSDLSISMSNLSRLVDDKNQVEAMRNLFELYSNFEKGLDEMDRYFDRLKRYFKLLVDSHNSEDSPEETEKRRAQIKTLVGEVYQEGSNFWYNNEGMFFRLKDMLATSYLFLNTWGAEGGIMKFSRERHLRALRYMLSHTDDLNTVSEFYEFERYLV